MSHHARDVHTSPNTSEPISGQAPRVHTPRLLTAHADTGVGFPGPHAVDTGGGHGFYPPPPPVAEPVAPPSPAGSRYRGRTLRTALVCGALVIGLSAVLVPALHTALKSTGGSSSSPGQALGGVLLQGGLPPTNQPLFGGETMETSTDPSTGGEDTLPPEPDTDGGVTTQPVDPPSSADTQPESDTLPETDETADPAETDPGFEESAPLDTPPVETTPPEPQPEQPQPTMPAGAISIVEQDLSYAHRGVNYIQDEAGNLPTTLPTDRLWATEKAPTVLLINTHPYEGYSDGGDWYDPATGGLAQTTAPGDPDGVVALTSHLTRLLREQGVTVIHLRMAVEAGETAASVYTRTQQLVDHYCDLYPDIGLVLDLRRSAELTDDGRIPATAGTWQDATCAQARFTISGAREGSATARDLALALALRQGLWDLSPDLSRPTLARPGGGIAAERESVATLTLELGSAGNTYDQAEALLRPVAEVLSRVILE